MLEKHNLVLIKAGMFSGDASTVESVGSHQILIKDPDTFASHQLPLLLLRLLLPPFFFNMLPTEEVHSRLVTLLCCSLFSWVKTRRLKSLLWPLFSLSCSFYFESVSSLVISFGS